MERRFGGPRSSGGFRSGPREGGFRRGGGGFRGGGFRSDGPREMHKAVCASCQKECEVPFKPTEGRPVYCRDCFTARRDGMDSSAPAQKPKAAEAAPQEEMDEAA